MTIEKYEATLVGCGIGDSLGMPVEGWSREQIAKYIGRITGILDPKEVAERYTRQRDDFSEAFLKFWNSELNLGDYTDDTILTMALAESLSIKGFDLEDAAQRQVREYIIRKSPDGTASGGFGKTTTEAFRNLEKGVSLYESGVIGGPGNAPAMKMSPVGLYMYATGKYEEGLLFAEQAGRITHLDPRSVASGVVQAHAVYSLLGGAGRDEFLEGIVEVCLRFEKKVTEEYTYPKSGSFLSRLNWVREKKDAGDDEAFTRLRALSVVYSSYPFALFMFQKYWDHPMEGLIELVNYGGDCDTTGAIYGSLAGARNGTFFPQEMEIVLKDATRMRALGKSICEVRNEAR